VANAVLDIFENENVLEENRKKAALMAQKMEQFREFGCVANIRQHGMVAAFDITGFKPEERIGLKVYLYGLKSGVLLRPLGHTIYFMPPYTISEEEIVLMIDTAYGAIREICG
jgi:adenosylmethionine-8-amino-7-oxononanoate aminotransferase